MDHNAEMISRSADGTVFDIGANHGRYTIDIAERKRRVFAFEPHHENIGILNGVASRFSNVTVVNKAISNHMGKVPMYNCKTNPGGHTIESAVGLDSIWGHSKDDVSYVETTTVDDFVKENEITDLVGIKIDVEGHEVAVIEGAIKTLITQAPLVSLETHMRVDVKRLYELIVSCGYTVFNQNNVITEMLVDSQYLLVPGSI